MAIVKKLSVDDPQGAPEIKDIGADAVNVDYDEEHSVKDKIDELSENVSILSSTVANKLNANGGSLAATVAGSVTTQISSSDVSSVDTAALIWGKFNALRKEFGDHANSPLYTENGIHGIRYYGGVLQVWDSINETWTDVGGGAEYPAGGATGQALVKASDNDNDVTWNNISLASNVSGILPVANGGTGATTISDARDNLGLGSLATKSSASLTTDVTDTLPLANGGTGATTAANARTNLGLGSLATKSTVSLTSDVSGTLPISKGGTGNSAGYIRAGQKSGTSIGSYATAEGYSTIASNLGSHAEGYNTTSSGSGSHAEGDTTTASGDYSHAEGYNTTASGVASHTEGRATTANAYNHAQGHYNKAMTAGTNNTTAGDAMAIGNGSSASVSNCFRVTYAGAVYGLSAFNSSGADYAEFFEWEDGNEKNEDRVGLFVTLNEDKIKLANTGDYILGVISGQPSIIGNGDEDWLGRWQRDDFDRFIWGEVEVEDPITKEKVKTKTILPNPEYDPEQKYIERKDRPEWDYVGMLGALAVRDDGTCEVNGFCRCGEGGIAIPAKSGYRVIKRVSNNVIKIIFSL